MPFKHRREWIVEESGWKLIQFLQAKLGPFFLSARALKKTVDQGKCWINGRSERFSSCKLVVGDRVVFHGETGVEQPLFLYEDASLVVCNKPAGVVCDEKGILSLLAANVDELALIHRLDKDTTGVLLLAKHPDVCR